jgi:hypothetical protein
MTPETMSRIVVELQQTYPGTLRAEDAGKTLVRLSGLAFPAGCVPATTDVLVVLDPSQPKPRPLVKHKPKTPRGVEPRNVNPENVGGECWFGFSYNVVWDENRHSAQQFVESAMRRFAKDE